MFWTTFIDPDNVEWDDDLEDASWQEKNFRLFDFHDIGNSLEDGPHPPAMVSLSMNWFGAGPMQRVRNTDEHFNLSWRSTRAAIAWSGRTQGGGGFVSDPAHTSRSFFGMLGNERNGVFFR